MKFISTLCLALISYATTYSWNNCGAAGSVASVTLIPAQPVRQHEESVNMIGKLGSTLTSGSIGLTITIIGIQVYKQETDICTILACPVAPGQFNATLVIPNTAIPSYSPAGQYTGHAEAKDQSGNLVACVNVLFSL